MDEVLKEVIVLKSRFLDSRNIEKLDEEDFRYLKEELRESASREEALKEQVQLLQQALDASKQDSEALQKEVRLLKEKRPYKPGQQLDASQEDLNLRELLKQFCQTRMGKEFNMDLMSATRSSFRQEFKDPIWNYYGQEIHTFSGMVAQLASLRTGLVEEKKNAKLSRERLSEIESKIESINKQLSCLEAVAKSYTNREMKWDESISKGFYFWCLFVADVNKACHRDMTDKLLRHIKNHAAKGEYNYGKEKLGPTIQRVILLLQLQIGPAG